MRTGDRVVLLKLRNLTGVIKHLDSNGNVFVEIDGHPGYGFLVNPQDIETVDDYERLIDLYNGEGM